jgi:hypothetical protein
MADGLSLHNAVSGSAAAATPSTNSGAAAVAAIAAVSDGEEDVGSGGEHEGLSAEEMLALAAAEQLRKMEAVRSLSTHRLSPLSP